MANVDVSFCIDALEIYSIRAEQLVEVYNATSNTGILIVDNIPIFAIIINFGNVLFKLHTIQQKVDNIYVISTKNKYSTIYNVSFPTFILRETILNRVICFRADYFRM